MKLTRAEWAAKHTDFRYVRPDGTHTALEFVDGVGTCSAPVEFPDFVEWFDPGRSTFHRQMAAGHAARLGHDLTGYYVPADIPGVVKMVRTCCTEPTSTGGTT